jgi:hypothetical protein
LLLIFYLLVDLLVVALEHVEQPLVAAAHEPCSAVRRHKGRGSTFAEGLYRVDGLAVAGAALQHAPKLCVLEHQHVPRVRAHQHPDGRRFAREGFSCRPIVDPGVAEVVLRLSLAHAEGRSVVRSRERGAT